MMKSHKGGLGYQPEFSSASSYHAPKAAQGQANHHHLAYVFLCSGAASQCPIKCDQDKFQPIPAHKVWRHKTADLPLKFAQTHKF